MIQFKNSWPVALAILIVFLSVDVSAQKVNSVPHVEYTVTTQMLRNHRLQVSAEFPPAAFPTSQRVLALPVWTPGSYKVRDYSRFLSTVSVDNPGATIKKVSKNRWAISGVSKNESIRVRYSVYGHELTVRTNYFTPDLSLLIGAATFLAPAPLQSDQMKAIGYRIAFPDVKDPIATSLKKQSDNSFWARDFDELVDSPILLGDLEFHSFQAGGKPHRLVQAGDTTYWDLATSLKDLQALVETIQSFWGVVPYHHYDVLNLITDSRGGLEHRASTVVMTSRFATGERESYLGWLSLISHEFFHTWNIKRLRPVALGPFDYESETYTRSLWVAEGTTSYYDDLFVRRAKLSSREEYLKLLSKQIERLNSTPGRLSITLGDASFDAWVRLYQETDDLHNSNVSYYNKGAIVAWLLDTEIRRLSKGEKSLDHVMREAYRVFDTKGYTESEFRQLASKVAGHDLRPFFSASVDSTAELDLQPALDYWNLQWEKSEKESEAYLGLEFEKGSSQAVVAKVYADSPAWKAGLAPGDEILAVDHIRIDQSEPLKTARQVKKKGEGYEVLYARRGRVHSTPVVPIENPAPQRVLKFGPSSPTYEALWTSWLGPERESVK